MTIEKELLHLAETLERQAKAGKCSPDDRKCWKKYRKEHGLSHTGYGGQPTTDLPVPSPPGGSLPGGGNGAGEGAGGGGDAGGAGAGGAGGGAGGGGGGAMSMPKRKKKKRKKEK